MKTEFAILSAPLQGYTDYVWRKAHHLIFGGVSRYYSPFIRFEHGQIMNRDLRDVACDNNAGVPFVPQVLAGTPDETAKLVLMLKKNGYRTIDLNMGCPFPPIALRHKGSGILPYPNEVKALFKVLSQIEDVIYSVKMRLGWESADEWKLILPCMDILTPRQVTIHPRVGRQQYKGEILMQSMNEILNSTDLPIIYNGDILTVDDVARLKSSHPALSGVMIGRALVSNPALLCPQKAVADNFRAFHDEIFQSNCQVLNGGEHQVLMKMKSFWELFLPDADRKCKKMIKKSNSLDKYNIAIDRLFSNFEQPNKEI